jgi:acetylornithine deacetylase/succinyl-diaminopimelate desuccinylase-like protein
LRVYRHVRKLAFVKGVLFGMEEMDRGALELFRSLVQIRSTSHLGPSSGAYSACVQLLESAAKERGFETKVNKIHDVCNKDLFLFPPFQVVELEPGHPILICTKEGTDPSLPSLLLNSHYDVVPAGSLFLFVFGFFLQKKKKKRPLFGRWRLLSLPTLLTGLLWGAARKT